MPFFCQDLKDIFENFTQILFGNLMIPNLFDVFAYKYLIITLLGLKIKKILERLQRNYLDESLMSHTFPDILFEGFICESRVEDLNNFSEAEMYSSKQLEVIAS